MGHAVDCPAYKDLLAKNPDSPEYKNISAEYKVRVCLDVRTYGVLTGSGSWLADPSSPFTQNLLCFHLPLFMYLLSSFLPLCPLDSTFSPFPPPPPTFPPLSSRLLSTFPLLSFPSPPPLPLLLSYPYVPLTSPFRISLCSFRTGLERPKSTCQMRGRLLMWSTCSVFTTFLPTCHGPPQRYTRH